LAEFDIKIDISATRKLSRYGFNIKRPSLFAKMGAGMLPNATRHTLLAFALISAMKTIPRITGKTASGHARPLRVLVRCSDETFVTACHPVYRVEKSRAAKTLWSELVQEMARFQLHFEFCDESKVTAARDFACRVLPTRTVPDGFPPPQLIITI